ncbi:Iron-responsive element-binding protein 2 [Characodon lateralis]|uniref:Iron-responsive element-binding protein 2 n=1 Tax=Characodon lateralis TaxID=208331 RepID=A0ABU7F437_9TELE|nr:Iron-responsive element-binding protein 2 [Characodon lateralis]
MALSETIKDHPYAHLIDTLKDGSIKFFNPRKLGDPRYDKLPLSVRILLEEAIRNCDGFYTKEEDVQNILDWQQQQGKVEVPFSPARVLLQDFTGIPAMVDLAAMRDAVAKHGVDPNLVNPKCHTDLIVDHSLQIDYSKCAIQNAPNPGGGDSSNPNQHPSRSTPARPPSRGGSHCGGQRGSCSKTPCSDPPTSSGRPVSVQQIENTPLLCPFHLQPVSEVEMALKNQEMELQRNKERLHFFKWCSKAFKNVNVVPPDVGAVHQVNLEYLSRVVHVSDGLIYPDSVVGTDSHTTMINGLGVLGWGVGGIESEAVMLGQPVSLTLPQVVGCKLVGSINPLASSIDIVLGITKLLRQAGISGKFVEFFGPGVSQLSAPDRTTIANMCPEYNATISFFPVDPITLKHFRKTNFTEEKLELLEAYMKAVNLFRSYEESLEDPQFSEVITINLSSMVPHVSGPKRAQDRVAVSSMKEDFQSCLNEKVGFKGFHISKEKQDIRVPFLHCGQEYQLAHGSVVIAAVISCTNNCNPSVMLTAGLMAKKAVEAGLVVKPYIQTSLAPGSGMVTHYLNASGVLPYFNQLGFEVVGYGCATCVGNTAPLPEAVVDAIKKGDLVACGVLSGNRHFEGRLCDCVRANYLASPPLVVAYAIAGTVGIDFEKEPLGLTSEGKEVYLRDIWPSREEVQHTEEDTVISSIFKDLRRRMEKGNTFWNKIECPDSVVFPWDHKSTYIRSPPFFSKLSKDIPAPQSIENAHALLFLGDKVTTDHISPAGSIARVSAAAKYLQSKRLTPREFNSYGARRGNDAVMTRGTFASIKLHNRFIGKPAPKTLHIPSTQTLDVFEAADRYQRDGTPLIILAGKDYGSGNSRDWVAKGPYLLGVRAVIAESFEKLHKNQLVGMGIMPLQFLSGQNADTLELSGKERFSVTLPESLSPRLQLTVKTSKGASFCVTALFDSEMDVMVFQHGGLLSSQV